MKKPCAYFSTIMPMPYERFGVSNHRQISCVNACSCQQRKHQSSTLRALCEWGAIGDWRIHLTKRQSMRQAITCQEVIISLDVPYHDDVIKWKHYTRYWPFVRGIHRSPVNSPHKGQ